MVSVRKDAGAAGQNNRIWAAQGPVAYIKPLYFLFFYFYF